MAGITNADIKLWQEIDDYHDTPWCFAGPPNGTFAIADDIWSPHSQLKALDAVVCGDVSKEYNETEIALYVTLAGNVVLGMDMLMDMNLPAWIFNDHRLRRIEKAMHHAAGTKELYDSLAGLVAFSHVDPSVRDAVCRVLRTGVLQHGDVAILNTFRTARDYKLFPRAVAESCLTRAAADSKAHISAAICLELGKEVEAEDLSDLSSEIPPRLRFVKAASRPNKPRSIREVSMWKRIKGGREADIAPGSECATEGCDNRASVVGRCLGYNCTKAECEVCAASNKHRLRCDACVKTCTGGCLSVATVTGRVIVYHMWSVVPDKDKTVVEYLRTEAGASCAIKIVKTDQSNPRTHSRTSLYFSSSEANGTLQTGNMVQYETLVQTRKNSPQGRMHQQIDRLISGESTEVYPHIRDVHAIDAAYPRCASCVLELL